MASVKKWIVERVTEDTLADKLNGLDAGKATFELHGIYPTGQSKPGPGGFEDKHPEWMIVGMLKGPTQVKVR
jgi:hypothetical protein